MNDLYDTLKPYVVAIVLATWGGVVKHIMTVKNQNAIFFTRDLLFHIIISGFVGMLAYFVCESASIGGATQALIVSITGHMGTETIASFKRIRNSIFERVDPGVREESDFEREEPRPENRRSEKDD